MKKKKTWIVLILLIIIWGSFFTTDLVRVRNNSDPIFCIPTARYKDGGSVDYLGVFYRVEKSIVYIEKHSFEYSISPWFL